jgi:hypothetical protein
MVGTALLAVSAANTAFPVKDHGPVFPNRDCPSRADGQAGGLGAVITGAGIIMQPGRPGNSKHPAEKLPLPKIMPVLAGNLTCLAAYAMPHIKIEPMSFHTIHTLLIVYPVSYTSSTGLSETIDKRIVSNLYYSHINYRIYGILKKEYGMKKRLVFALPLVVTGLLVAIGPFTLFPVCEVAGDMIMKCFWTARAELGIGISIAILGGLSLAFKSPLVRLGLALASLLNAALALLIPTVLIGVCEHRHADCRVLALPALLILSVILLLIAGFNTALLLSAKKKEIKPWNTNR